MGSSSKAGKGKKKEISDHALTLRRRLHEALSLGIRFVFFPPLISLEISAM